MVDDNWYHHEARVTVSRLLPRLENVFSSPADFEIFSRRLAEHFPRAFRELLMVYGNTYDFFYHLEQILHTCAEMFVARPVDLRELDQQRETDPLWYKSEHMIGGVCYVDLFAGDLEGIRQKIPYFQELGLTYLHLMPLCRAP
jgi:amylosucrase